MFCTSLSSFSVHHLLPCFLPPFFSLPSRLLFQQFSAPPFHSVSPSVTSPPPPEQHLPPPCCPPPLMSSTILLSFLHHHLAPHLHSPPHLLVHLHSIHLLLHFSSSETHATAGDRCAFHTLFVFLFCHSTKLQRSSLITPVPLTAYFFVSRLMFPPACWQCCQAQGLRCTERWRSEISPDTRGAKSKLHTATEKAKVALRILKDVMVSH